MARITDEQLENLLCVLEKTPEWITATRGTHPALANKDALIKIMLKRKVSHERIRLILKVGQARINKNKPS